MMTQYLAINAAKVAGVTAASGATTVASAAGVSIGLAVSTKIALVVGAVAAIVGGGVTGNIVANSDYFKAKTDEAPVRPDYFNDPKVLKAWEEISLNGAPSSVGFVNETAAPSMTSTEAFARIEPTTSPEKQANPSTPTSTSAPIENKPRSEIRLLLIRRPRPYRRDHPKTRLL
jgi:hypothetical protein